MASWEGGGRTYVMSGNVLNYIMMVVVCRGPPGQLEIDLSKTLSICYLYCTAFWGQLLDGEEKKDFRDTVRSRGSQICISGTHN